MLEIYNNRGHRGIGWITPNEGDELQNQPAVFNANNKRYYEAEKKRKKAQHKVGDTVLLKSLPGRFARGYHERFNHREYKIVKVKENMPRPMYILEDLDPKPGEDPVILGGAYDEELQPIRRIEDEYKVEKVLRKEKRGRVWWLYVKWEGWSERHNSWIKESDVTQVY